ncbi:MAG: molecular chaperone DnaJ [Candidatus Wildermuthbacteria bacterium]|nr:molecular chaperone DnaJ [Candidatus Wildermuthbacteria bacterium]
MKDYYKILGVSKESSPDDIKKAYRKLAHKYHPDKGGDAQKFKEVTEAYQVLSDNEKRAQYDRFGRVFDGGGAGPESQHGFGGFRWAWGQPGSSGYNSEEEGEPIGFDFQDLGEIFEEFFGGNAGKEKNPKRGKDIEVELEIPLEAALQGKEEKITVPKLIACERCQGVGAEPGTKVNECFSCRGSGEVQQIKRTVFGSFTKVAPCPECNGDGLKPERPCNVCKGEGRIAGQEEVNIAIPPGVDSHQILKFDRRGEAGRKKGRGGDLYVRIFVKPHPTFHRKGDDLHITLPIAFSQAALGDEVEVPTLDGTNILLAVPQGSESGKVLRVSGKGIPHFGGWGRGDLYVKLILQTPKKLTKEQKELLEQLKEMGL